MEHKADMYRLNKVRIYKCSYNNIMLIVIIVANELIIGAISYDITMYIK